MERSNGAGGVSASAACVGKEACECYNMLYVAASLTRHSFTRSFSSVAFCYSVSLLLRGAVSAIRSRFSVAAVAAPTQSRSRKRKRAQACRPRPRRPRVPQCYTHLPPAWSHTWRYTCSPTARASSRGVNLRELSFSLLILCGVPIVLVSHSTHRLI